MKRVDGIKEAVYDITHPGRIPVTFPQKAADEVTRGGGSWTFIMTFVIIIIVWIFLILYLPEMPPELDHFLILNLFLSCLAAIQAPIILMSQNRAGQKESQKMEYDYQLNKKSEKEIEELKKQLDRIERKLR